ncbi:mannose-1-phosphate guanylyltransferase [Aeromicrobium sp. CF3.5]|uniref:mannose-1-phosphate guanylyltransferase n=1 Tax=Aeromicrobium sp. CF3.5 TaxID=3373078 RepID=UPI003EE4FCDA
MTTPHADPPPRDPLESFHAIIPAGGAGTRLWPLSRRDRPKFLIDLDGSGRSLVQQTWDRLLRLIPAERIHVVTGAAHAAAISEQLPDLQHLLVEPSARDSMPAIGWAAAVIHATDPDAVVGSFAADHVIGDDEAFAAAVREAAALAAAGLVATVGITPTTASTAFGYIESGDPLDIAGAPHARAITTFVEKPDSATAEHYVQTGRFSWNAGMFVTRTAVLLDHLARLQPTLHAGLVEIAGDADALARVWPTLTPIAIDHAIAEPVSREGAMTVVPGTFSWNDIGDFAALATLRDSDAGAVWIDADGLAISDDDTVIAVVGLHDVVVVRTRDAVLVTTREHAQQVKQVPAALKAAGRENLV